MSPSTEKPATASLEKYTTRDEKRVEVDAEGDQASAEIETRELPLRLFDEESASSISSTYSNQMTSCFSDISSCPGLETHY